MSWDIAPEYISIVILSIIWVYSRKSNIALTLKNRLFQGCFLVSFIAMGTNILSTFLITHHRTAPLSIAWIVTTVYFIFTPLMGMVYSFYAIAVAYEGKKSLKRLLIFWALPCVPYLFIVLMNCFTGILFRINRETGYHQGPLVSVTYIVFYFYCLLSVIFIFRNRKTLDPQVFRILISFPAIAAVVIIVQQIYPSFILSGSAATCALLIIYLHLQNRQISTDYITNLPNRGELLAIVDLMLKKGSSPFTLMILSLRDFKQVNDAFGQQSGDYVLKFIGQYLVSLCGRTSVFRFKGDEFAILLKDNSAPDTKKCIRQIQERFLLPWKIKDIDYRISYAIGAANYPDTATTLEPLLLATEDAVSTAKNEGHNTVCFFDQEMLGRLQRKKEIVQILKEKLESKDFSMYYQPIISLDSGKFEYAESLMRIEDSALGRLSPAEFIPIAEETGLIIDLTYVILDKVCRFVHDIQMKHPDLKCVHVNFSALQFRQENLATRVLEIISRNEIPFSSIKIEVTESAVAENTETVIRFASEMKKHGISMGLDDFGIGYSNISTVINLPFNTLKLDKSLVYTAIKQERFAFMLRSLIGIFKQLDMKVIAEGVETSEEGRFVAHCGADLIQGFYYARPMPAETIDLFLQSPPPVI